MELFFFFRNFPLGLTCKEAGTGWKPTKVEGPTKTYYPPSLSVVSPPLRAEQEQLHLLPQASSNSRYSSLHRSYFSIFSTMLAYVSFFAASLPVSCLFWSLILEDFCGLFDSVLVHSFIFFGRFRPLKLYPAIRSLKTTFGFLLINMNLISDWFRPSKRDLIDLNLCCRLVL